MDIRTFKLDDGKFMYAVQFKKGTGALRLKSFDSKAEMNKAIKAFKDYHGEAWEKNDLVWDSTNPITGHTTQLFRRITFDDVTANF